MELSVCRKIGDFFSVYKTLEFMCGNYGINLFTAAMYFRHEIVVFSFNKISKNIGKKINILIQSLIFVF